MFIWQSCFVSVYFKHKQYFFKLTNSAMMNHKTLAFVWQYSADNRRVRKRKHLLACILLGIRRSAICKQPHEGSIMFYKKFWHARTNQFPKIGYHADIMTMHLICCYFPLIVWLKYGVCVLTFSLYSNYELLSNGHLLMPLHVRSFIPQVKSIISLRETEVSGYTPHSTEIIAHLWEMVPVTNCA